MSSKAYVGKWALMQENRPAPDAVVHPTGRNDMELPEATSRQLAHPTRDGRVLARIVRHIVRAQGHVEVCSNVTQNKDTGGQTKLQRRRIQLCRRTVDIAIPRA